MSEGEVRQLAQLMALVADVEQEKAYLQGMIAKNKEREAEGMAAAYTEHDFSESAKLIGGLADRMRKEIKHPLISGGEERNTMSSESNSRPLDLLVISQVEILDEMDKEERLEAIDDILRRMNFERRLTMLTELQLQHMHDNSLSKMQRDRIDECKTEDQRDKVIEGYARANYFRQCAWADYLNGAVTDPPVGV